ncbi:MAG: MucB/RseB C-terminal domain-containing protein [Hydrogenophaga sp.]|nr:MucB/RseB C-terminal domain-containing protein [Hydrogenophaga sp.]
MHADTPTTVTGARVGHRRLPAARRHSAPRLRRWGAALIVSACAGWGVTPSMAQTQESSGLPQVRGVNEWLTRMHEASRYRAYTGTLVVTAGSAMSAAKIWHVCDGNQQMERVETLTGAPRTTIRRNSEVITFEPETRKAVVEKRESLGMFPDLLRAPKNLIPQFYGSREVGTQRVAGHLSDMVEIQPRDEFRFGYRVWSEQKSGLVVKLQTLDGRGRVIEQVAFSELQLDAPVSMDKLARLMKDTRGYEVIKPTLRKTTPQAEGWRLSDNVPGFTPMSCHTRDADGSSAPGQAPMQWVFSDGLASVSLFVEPFDAQRHGQEGEAALGATHSVSRRVGEHWVTAVGEVPAATLQRFTQALERIR